MNWLKLFIACLCMPFVFAGCSDSTKITGTSEETNEMAREELSSSSATSSSSSSELESSSSATPESSSTEKQQSSSAAPESSSSEKLSSSSIRPERSSSSSTPSSSSNPTSTHEGTAEPGTLEYYASLLGIMGAKFDDGVLEAGVFKPESSTPDTSDQHPPMAQAGEFGGYDVHPFNNKNIFALPDLFPEMAAYANAEFVDSLAAEKCHLYMLNARGTDTTVGSILTKVAKDSVTVIHIQSSKCEASQGQVRFLFTYCGTSEIIHPEVKNVMIDADIPANKCPTIPLGEEWTNKRD